MHGSHIWTVPFLEATMHSLISLDFYDAVSVSASRERDLLKFWSMNHTKYNRKAIHCLMSSLGLSGLSLN